MQGAGCRVGDLLADGADAEGGSVHQERRRVARHGPVDPLVKFDGQISFRVQGLGFRVWDLGFRV